MAIVGAAGLVLLLLLVVVIAKSLQPHSQDGQLAGTGDAQASEDAEGQGSADGTDTVDLDSAELGDVVAVGGESHNDTVDDVAIAELSDGTPVAVTGGGDLVAVWDLRTGELTGSHPSDGQGDIEVDILDIDDRTMVLSRSTYATGPWSLDDPAQELEASGMPSDIETIEWVGSWYDGAPVYVDDYYDVVDLVTGERLAFLAKRTLYWWSIMEIDGELRGVGVLPADGVNVINDQIVVHDLESGDAVIGTFDPLPELPAEFTADHVGDLALAVTAAYDGTIQAWNLETAEQYGTAAHDLAQEEIQGLDLFQMNGQTAVLTWSSAGLSLFDVESGQQIGETFGQPDTGEVTSAAVAEVDGHPVAVTGTSEGRVTVWSLGQ
jgi:WD40 repeat protein